MTACYAFFSVKGGVGKSALTAAAAVAFARTGRTVAVIDGDLSGTSLADGLRLRAPDTAPGWASSGGHLTLDETRRRRRDQAERRAPTELPFFDAMVVARSDFEPDAVAWIHDDEPTIRWYPSSPTPRDTAASVRALMQDPEFGTSLQGVVARIRSSVVDGVVLVDAHPGMYGVPTWVARMEGVIPVLVTTDDRNDLYRSADEYPRLRKAFPKARWLLNRNVRVVQDVRDDLRDYLREMWPTIERDLREVGRQPDLEGIFRADRLMISADLGSRLVQLLEEDR